jgi:hypothetical protein
MFTHTIEEISKVLTNLQTRLDAGDFFDVSNSFFLGSFINSFGFFVALILNKIDTAGLRFTRVLMPIRIRLSESGYGSYTNVDLQLYILENGRKKFRLSFIAVPV